MAKQWRYGQKSNRRRISVGPPDHIRGSKATIRAGSKSLYGVHFENETVCVFDAHWNDTPGYYAMKLADNRVVLVFREDVQSEYLK